MIVYALFMYSFTTIPRKEYIRMHESEKERSKKLFLFHTIFYGCMSFFVVVTSDQNKPFILRNSTTESERAGGFCRAEKIIFFFEENSQNSLH
jgi:hypothetical protein